MNFICSKQKLQEGISIVTKAITGKTTMPILEGIYIEANNEGLTLIGSDMDVSIETKVEARSFQRRHNSNRCKIILRY